MSRTLLGEDQVIDEEFLSEEEFNIRRPHSIHDSTVHTDILTTPADGQALVWSDASSGYVHQSIAGGHGREHNIISPLDHTDTTGTPSQYSLLIYIDNLWQPISFSGLINGLLLTSVSGDLLTTSSGEIVTVS